MSDLSSEIVSDGAFFPQPDPHMPEEEMSQDAREHVMAPAGVFSHLVLIQISSVFVSSKHCSMAYRMPLSQAKVFSRVATGALLIWRNGFEKEIIGISTLVKS